MQERWVNITGICNNQLMEAADNYIGATGLPAKGLQIFYPVHPRLMVCLYDANVYDLGNGCTNACTTESVSEIHQLNALQFINSKSQLFFDEIVSEDYVKALCKEYNQYRKPSRFVSKIVTENARKFFFTGIEDARISLDLGFFKTLINPNDFKDKIVPLRHPSFTRPPIEKISFNL